MQSILVHTLLLLPLIGFPDCVCYDIELNLPATPTPDQSQPVALRQPAYEPTGAPVTVTLATDPPVPIPVALITDPPPTPPAPSASDLNGDYYRYETEMPTPAGIYFRISQKGIDYITDLAVEALPQLLENSVLPAVDHPQIKITQLTIEKFSKPVIQANFIAHKGVGAHIHLPQVMVSAVYDADTFFSSYKGKFKADVRNLTVIMEVHISRNESEKHNIIETPVCNVTSSQVRIVFAGDMSTYLNLMRSVIEQTVIDVLGNELCQTAIRVAQFFEQQKRQILMTTIAPPSTTPTPEPTHLLHYGQWSMPGTTTTTTASPMEEENENQFYESSDEDQLDDEDLAAKFAADLCSEDSEHSAEDYSPTQTLRLRTERRSIRTTVKPERFNRLLVEGLWAPDLTLMYAPKFTSQDVVFGLDGGIVFYGRKASGVDRPKMLNITALGDQMFGLIISEYVPNTFFAHVFDENLGTVQETFRTHSLPKFIKPIAKLLCSQCALQLIANLTARPVMSINRNGVKLEIHGDIAITFLGKTRRINVVSASAMLDVTVKPYLKYSHIYGDVALTGVDIRIKGMGIGGMFSNSVRKALNAVVPKKLWAKIKKRLRFALNQRGIKLPVMCGVDLVRPSMSYIDHAIIVDTDFRYNLPRFIKKFKAYIKAEVARARKKQRLESDEEYDGL